jgi:hypothetical protein
MAEYEDLHFAFSCQLQQAGGNLLDRCSINGVNLSSVTKRDTAPQKLPKRRLLGGIVENPESRLTRVIIHHSAD